MKLAISNIAWEAHEDSTARHVLARLGIPGLEVAPTRIHPSPTDAPLRVFRDFRSKWTAAGIRIVAMQSLLYGHPELTLFADPDVSLRTLDYLRRMIDIAAELGAGTLVFGSPRNRLVGQLPLQQARETAVKFFRLLGTHAASQGVCFCIEPNPATYGCDFILDSSEGADLVRRVDSAGFGLHLDIAAMVLTGENPLLAVASFAPLLRHFHVSAPQLAHVRPRPDIDFAAILAQLAATPYRGWVSIEMRAQGENIARIQEALTYIRSITHQPPNNIRT